MEDYAKIYWAGLQWETVEHKIGKLELSLQNNCFQVTKLQLRSLVLENHSMKSTICTLNTELEDSKKMLAENQPLVSLGAQLSKLNAINKQPPSLDADTLYAMSQLVLLKASPEELYLGGGLIVAGVLASLGVNDNNIISGIYN